MPQSEFGHQSRPFLPQSLEGRLVGSLLRGAGAVLLLCAAAGWLSLITWSALDPSLTHATAGPTRNWLGPIGAILSDLFLQTLGFVAILAFLAPAFWGYEFLSSERVLGLRVRLWAFPAAIVILAGAFSSLPAPSSWPMNHGLGGMTGDTVFSLIAGALAMLNPARAGAVAGLVLFTGGMGLLAIGLGLSQKEWSLLWQRAPRAMDAARPSNANRWSSLWMRWFAAAEPQPPVRNERRHAAPAGYAPQSIHRQDPTPAWDADPRRDARPLIEPEFQFEGEDPAGHDLAPEYQTEYQHEFSRSRPAPTCSMPTRHLSRRPSASIA